MMEQGQSFGDIKDSRNIRTRNQSKAIRMTILPCGFFIRFGNGTKRSSGAVTLFYNGICLLL
jgi:hypothetical protein